MRRLRDPVTGCPWDIKQNFKSITSSTIEEAYEVVDAIESGDREQIKEELGDLLFQIIFYCELAEEESSFDLDAVVDGITQKLIRRHPHVFPDGRLTSSAQSMNPAMDVKKQWEKIKSEERANKGLINPLDDIPLGLPALMRAFKMQKRAARVGLDWPSLSKVMDKLQEELGELKKAVAENHRSAIADELGDVLFSVVNIARHLDCEPESSLRQANAKFANRFRHVVEQAKTENIDLTELSPEQLDNLWINAKKMETPVTSS
jgi:ATP diphosphatase